MTVKRSAIEVLEDLRLRTEPRRFLVTRKFMDPRRGNKGIENLVVRADNAADASRLASLTVYDDNISFKLEMERKRMHAWWESDGWLYPDKVIKRLGVNNGR